MNYLQKIKALIEDVRQMLFQTRTPNFDGRNLYGFFDF